jgi:hypothetical protein
VSTEHCGGCDACRRKHQGLLDDLKRYRERFASVRAVAAQFGAVRWNPDRLGQGAPEASAAYVHGVTTCSAAVLAALEGPEQDRANPRKAEGQEGAKP